MLEAVFWLSVGTLAYAWIGYPFALAVAGLALSPRRYPTTSWCPRLSVIVAAHNEAAVIAAKVAGTLAQHYPPDRLEVIVVSDGSTDGTDDLVRAHQDPRVRLVRQEPRAGKSAALNRGVAAARGEILVFTDANALFAPRALAHLAAPFRDPRVGLVSGVGLYAPEGGPVSPGARAAGNGYAWYETLVKRGEGRLGFLAAADGAVYALRRTLHRPLHPREVNDLLHPIQVALAGYTCRFDERAFTVEPPSTDTRAEFRRHVRIIAQGADLLRTWLLPLARAQRWRAVWTILSHRVLRWTGALWLTGALLASVALAGTHPVYTAALALQLAFYALALVGLAAERRGVAFGRLALPAYFCVVSAAGAAGLVRALRQGGDATWTPRGQAHAQDRAA